MNTRNATSNTTAFADGGGGDGLPGTPWPGPQDPPTPDGGPGVPNPPKSVSEA
ncbi:hypothetical protein [Streptomyces sp. A0958]|uniref:hypothetical protein n=1 Tax=Streptomyces sp. A0958 TaxID=2563101 RepID=UPI001446F4D5|nr:hypothetical protein [Streptomyces sp. A0958]